MASQQKLEVVEEGAAMLSKKPILLKRSTTKGFSAEAKIIYDEPSGVTFMEGYESAKGEIHPPKVLKYDAAKVLTTLSPWRALFKKLTLNATALSGNGLAAKVLGYTLIALVFTILGKSPLLETSVEQALVSLNQLFSSGLLFLLGPFVGLSLSRWWAIRKDGLGKLSSVVSDLSTYASAWFRSGSSQDLAARKLNLRLGLLSNALLYKRARGESSDREDLEDLVESGLLLEHEAEVLAPLPFKAQVVWAWMTAFWSQAADPDGKLGVSAPPCGPRAFGIVMKQCMDARGAIALVGDYLETQIPYPYAHLLSVIIDVALCVNAIAVGATVGEQLNGSTSFNAVLLVAFGLLRVAAFTLVYNGMLSISVIIENPLGTDEADFPARAYQAAMRAECEAFAIAVDAVPSWPGLGVDA